MISTHTRRWVGDAWDSGTIPLACAMIWLIAMVVIVSKVTEVTP